MTTAVRTTLVVATFVAIVVLAILGERLAPPMQAPVGRDSRKQGCSVDAPEPLKAAAKRWCANGLFVRVGVKADEKNVIAVMQFTPNGAQTWELQSSLLMSEFRNLTDQLAADASGRDIGVALHDAADHRVGACARATTDKETVCSTK